MDDTERADLEQRKQAALTKLERMEDENPIMAIRILDAISDLHKAYLVARSELEQRVAEQDQYGGLICWDYEGMRFKSGLHVQVPPGAIMEHFHRRDPQTGQIRIRIGCPFDPETWGEFMDEKP